MKRLLFIFAILIIMGIVGFYVAKEFEVPEITYVSDTQKMSSRGNELVIYRLYTSGVDIETFMANIESSLITTEFTEEEIAAAAIASGKPEFYPAFYLKMFYPDVNKQNFLFEGAVHQTMAQNQKTADFIFQNLQLELVSEGLDIEEVSFFKQNEDIQTQNVPVISEDKRSMAMNLDNISYYSFNLKGSSGKLTFQFTYDIISNSFFATPALQGQLLIVYADVMIDEGGAMQIQFVSEPFSSLEEFAEY